MSSDVDELVLLLKQIDRLHDIYDVQRLKEDLMLVLLFINASMLLGKVDINAAKMMMDLSVVEFTANTEFVYDAVQHAMSYVMHDSHLPAEYAEKEYITPLRKLEDFFISTSTQVCYKHGRQPEEVLDCS